MAIALLVVGLAAIVPGVLLLVLPSKKTATAQGAISDTAKLLAEFNKLLDKFDKRYRPGLVLLSVGLVLVILSVLVETKDAVKEVAAPALASVLQAA